MIASWQESSDKPRQCVKKQKHHFADKGSYSQSYGLSSSHIQMWELEHKEGRAPKNWCFWTMVLEKTLESLLDSKEIKPVSLKGNQPWILIGSWKLKLQLQYFGHLMWRADLLEKTLILGKMKAEGEEGDRGWDGWMASLVQWTWTWANSGRWWGTGKPGELQSMGLRRVGWEETWWLNNNNN